MKMKKIIFLALIFEFAFVATNAFAAVPKVSFLNSLLFQGDTLVASIAARTRASPGSLMAGVPASETSATSPVSSTARMRGVRSRWLCSL